jgi:hypothetical protein
MTTQQKAWTNLGFRDIDQYYLAKALLKQHARKPIEPAPEPEQLQACDPAVDEYKGVCFAKKRGDYQATYYCAAAKKVYHIGYRDTVKQAANLRARWIAANYPELDL